MFLLMLSGICAFAALYVITVRGGSDGRRVGEKSSDALHDDLALRWQTLKSRFVKNKFIKVAQEKTHLLGLADECTTEMPEFLDIVSLGLSAGLSFDASLELYCKYSHSSLATEFQKSLFTWQMGLVGRSEALHILADSIQSAPLKRFCASVCEALIFGAPLATTLERQSDVLREEQRALSQERIEEVPVRMLIPLGTLVVPAMLLAILGPLLASSVLV